MPPRKSDNDAERLARLNLRLDRLRESTTRTQKSRKRANGTPRSSTNQKKR